MLHGCEYAPVEHFCFDNTNVHSKASVQKVYAIIALVVALAGAGLVANKLWTKSLTEQAAKTEAALQQAEYLGHVAHIANMHADAERRRAAEAEARAQRAEARAAVLAEHADSIAAFAPDTCRPYIVAQQDARAEIQHALDEQKQATARLKTAAESDSLAIGALLTGLGTATDAAQDLVNSTHRSFFLRIMPKPGIAVTAGVTPQGKFAVVGGVSLGWNF